MRTRFVSVVAASLLCPSCLIAYLPSAPIPGRFHPETKPMGVEVALDGDLGRSFSSGVTVSDTGALVAEATANNTQWPGADLALRWGLTDWLALEGRLTGSMVFPVPLPLPNGVGLAPIVKLAEPVPTLKLFTSPRFLTVNGQLVAVITNDLKRVDKRSGLGAELPLMVTWDPVDWFGLTATVFGRGMSMTGSRGQTAGTQGPEASWATFGYGGALQGTLTFGLFRFGLGGGFEAVPNPGYDLTRAACTAAPCALPEQWSVVPQFGATLAVVFR